MADSFPSTMRISEALKPSFFAAPTTAFLWYSRSCVVAETLAKQITFFISVNVFNGFDGGKGSAISRYFQTF